MRHIILWLIITLGSAVYAAPNEPLQNNAQPNVGSVNEVKKFCRSSELVLADPDNVIRFDETFKIEVTGDCLSLIRDQRQRSEISKVVTVYLDGVPMRGLPLFLSESKDGAVTLSVTLVRNSENNDNRLSWHGILSKRRTDLPMALPVSISIGADLPVDVKSSENLKVNTIRGAGWLVLLTIALGLAILFGSFYLLRKGDSLRDEPGGTFSLGKSQMAFWGLLVFFSFFAVWILTGGMERIPPQTLMLLGISGGTGLAAVLIGQTKDSPELRLDSLQKEDAVLQAKVTAATATADDFSRINVIAREISALHKRAQLKHVSWREFFRDICSDGAGLSFPRVQVVMWTLTLGCIFVWTIAQMISMPEFPETLLLLLGISNGTYIGFKFPEK